MARRSALAALVAAIVFLSLCFTAYAQEQPPTQPPTEGEPPAPGYVYFYLDGEPAQVQREIAGGSQVVEFAVLELLKGPTEEEKAAGYVTYIPEGVKLQYTTVKQDRSEFSVNLSRELMELSGDKDTAIKALTQITKTVQDVSGVAMIGITVAGEGMGDPPQDAYEALGVSREETGNQGQGSEPASGGGNTGLVLGIIFGVLGAAVIAFLIIYLLKKRKPAAAQKAAGKKAAKKKAKK